MVKPKLNIDFFRPNSAGISSTLSTSRRNRFTSYDTLWLMAIIAMGMAPRICLLFQPMRYDESFTFLVFANRSVLDLFYYPLPNNHVLHTLLIRLSTFMLGAHPISIRLPAFLAGIASIPLIFHVSRKLINERSGFLAALAMSIFPYLVFYSTIARGYSLLIVFTLWLLLAGENYCKMPSWRRCASMAVIASLGMLTMPTMLFAIAGIYLWVACVLFSNKQRVGDILRYFLIPCSILTVICSIFMYIPSIVASDGIETIVSNRFVTPSPWRMFVGQIYPHAREIFSDMSRNIPFSVQLFLAMMLIAGLLLSLKKRLSALFLLLPSIIIGSLFIFFVKHRIPFVRTWIFLIPIVFIVADAGPSYLLEKFYSNLQSLYPLALLFFGLLFSASLISENTLAAYPDTGYFPEAPIVAKKLSAILDANDRIHVKPPADWPVYFYLWYLKIPKVGKAADHGLKTEFYIIKKDSHTISEMTTEAVVKIFDADNAAIYRRIQADKQK